jgi:hypothetical protein
LSLANPAPALVAWIALLTSVPVAMASADDASGEQDMAAPGTTNSAPMMFMLGMYGPYPMSRESSGTSWQPDSTPMEGIHQMSAQWMTMWDGFANLIYDDQGGPRGNTQTFSNSMLMFMGRRDLSGGDFAVRLMVSADPLMGRDGYPELFQTGESGNGVTPLIDRQHPHNFLMEAAGTYTVDVGSDSAAFLYAGVAGEPALGPPAFMHRFSGEDNPEAPLSHHWLDSTHITYGVVTAGYVWGRVKLEASSFNGREPDQDRYDIETRHLDSYSGRLSYNPSADWSLQISTGRLASPEQLQPNVAEHRTTASVSYNHMSDSVQWQTTAAFGRDDPMPGTASDAWLLESAAIVADHHTLFARIERVAKDQLFLPELALSERTFTINSASLGYIYDVLNWQPIRVGFGGMITGYRYPGALDAAYGDGPVSFLLFGRVKL